MSTRSSIVYVAGLHIFEEVLDGNICIQNDELRWNKPSREIDPIYHCPIITRAELIEIRDQIDEYLWKNK